MKSKINILLIVLVLGIISLLSVQAADVSVATNCYTQYREGSASWADGVCRSDDGTSLHLGWPFYIDIGIDDAIDRCRVVCSYTTISDFDAGDYYDTAAVLALLGDLESEIFANVSAEYYDKDEVDAMFDTSGIHSSIEFYYTPGSDDLKVTGHGPTDAGYVSILFRSESDSNPMGHPQPCLKLDGDMNFVEYHYKPQTGDSETHLHKAYDAWKNDTYYLQAMYWEDRTACLTKDWSKHVWPRANGGEFNWLIINQIKNEISLIQDDIDTLYNEIEEVNDDLLEKIEDLREDLTELNDTVIDIRTDLDILTGDVRDLEDDVRDLEDEVEELWLIISEIGDFGMQFNQDEMELFIDGSGAPRDAQYAKITVKTVDGNPVEKITVEVDSNGEFYNEFDVEDWPYEAMNIYVTFYENRRSKCSWFFGCYYKYSGRISTIYDIFDSLVNENDYGFEHIDTETYETFYMNHEIERNIGYSIMPHVDGLAERILDAGLYRVVMTQIDSNNGEDISTVLEACTWLDADVENALTSSFMIPETGTYMVKLEAIRAPFCNPDFGNEVIESNRFMIDVIDLRFEMEEAELTVISPESNNQDVFWTRSDNVFELAGVVKFNGQEPDTNGADYCTMSELSPENWGLSKHLPKNPEGDYMTCLDSFSMTQLNSLEYNLDGEGVVYEIEIKMATSYTDPTDTIKIGIDDTEPVVNDIFPAEENKVSGTVLFTTNVTDTYSGVRNVDLSLILKNGSVIMWTHAATYNTTTELWGVELDTTQVPDGNYNISAEAWDYAGNYGSLMVDPIIDNTAPVITLLNKSFVDSVRQGDLLYFKIQVDENLAGIDEDTIALTMGDDLTCELVKVSGDEFTAIYETDGDCYVPYNESFVEGDEILSFTFTASDLAVPANEGTLEVSVDLYECILIDYYPDFDNDGFGELSNNTILTCMAPLNYSEYSTDCNNNNSAINPDAVDICGNGIDEDCSGSDAVCPVVNTYSGGSSGGGSAGYRFTYCNESELCGSWSSCEDSKKTRTCETLNNCRWKSEPVTEKDCSVVKKKSTETTPEETSTGQSNTPLEVNQNSEPDEPEEGEESDTRSGLGSMTGRFLSNLNANGTSPWMGGIVILFIASLGIFIYKKYW